MSAALIARARTGAVMTDADPGGIRTQEHLTFNRVLCQPSYNDTELLSLCDKLAGSLEVLLEGARNDIAAAAEYAGHRDLHRRPRPTNEFVSGSDWPSQFAALRRLFADDLQHRSIIIGKVIHDVKSGLLSYLRIERQRLPGCLRCEDCGRDFVFVGHGLPSESSRGLRISKGAAGVSASPGAPLRRPSPFRTSPFIESIRRPLTWRHGHSFAPACFPIRALIRVESFAVASSIPSCSKSMASSEADRRRAFSAHLFYPVQYHTPAYTLPQFLATPALGSRPGVYRPDKTSVPDAEITDTAEQRAVPSATITRKPRPACRIRPVPLPTIPVIQPKRQIMSIAETEIPPARTQVARAPAHMRNAREDASALSTPPSITTLFHEYLAAHQHAHDVVRDGEAVAARIAADIPLPPSAKEFAGGPAWRVIDWSQVVDAADADLSRRQYQSAVRGHPLFRQYVDLTRAEVTAEKAENALSMAISKTPPADYREIILKAQCYILTYGGTETGVHDEPCLNELNQEIVKALLVLESPTRPESAYDAEIDGLMARCGDWTDADTAQAVDIAISYFGWWSRLPDLPDSTADDARGAEICRYYGDFTDAIHDSPVQGPVGAAAKLRIIVFNRDSNIAADDDQVTAALKQMTDALVASSKPKAKRKPATACTLNRLSAKPQRAQQEALHHAA